MSNEIQYKDSDGNKCTLLQLVKREPEWAESTIKWNRHTMNVRDAELLAAEEDIKKLEATLIDLRDTHAATDEVKDIINSVLETEK